LKARLNAASDLYPTRLAILAGLLLADQGAEVYAARPEHQDLRLDDYLSRGTHFTLATAVATAVTPDIVIHDGATAPTWAASQLSLGFTAVAPGDEQIDIPGDASDDLLNALVGGDARSALLPAWARSV
jgi:hypothetical protein